MVRNTMQVSAVAVEEELKVEWWRLSDLGAEYNIQNEFDQRFESLQAARVVNIPLSTEALWGLTGWTPADSLAIHITAGALYCYPGVGYVGPSRYVRTADGDISLTPADNTYYIRLQYDATTDTHSFIAEVSETADTADVKYITLAQATRSGATWTAIDADLRSSNTSLLPPVTFSGSSANPILTLQQDGAGIAFKINDGDIQLGQAGTPVVMTLYGTSATGFTLADNASANTVDISCDASGRLKVTGSLNVSATGTIIASSASVGGVTLNVGAMSAITTIAMSGQFTSTLVTGTAPFSIASTTVVPNLNADQVDGYDLNQALLTSSTPSFVKLTLSQATGTAPMTIASTTMTPNLNADLLDGSHAAAFAASGHTHSFSNITVATGNVDMGSYEFRAKTFESDQTTGTAPFVVASTTVVSNLNADRLDGSHASAFALSGHVHSFSALTAATGNVDMGGYEFRAKTFESDQTTGTAPFTIASTTVVTNLNAQLWGGALFSSYLNQAVKTTSSPTFTALTLAGALSGVSNIGFDGNIECADAVFRLKCGSDTTAYPNSSEIDNTSLCDVSAFSVYHLYYDQITASPSSEIMKDNIVEADIDLLSGYLDSVLPKNFMKKRRPGKEEVGVIAEDLPEIARTYDPDGRLAGYSPDVLMMLMLAKLKTLQSEVNTLKTQLEDKS